MPSIDAEWEKLKEEKQLKEEMQQKEEMPALQDSSVQEGMPY